MVVVVSPTHDEKWKRFRLTGRREYNSARRDAADKDDDKNFFGALWHEWPWIVSAPTSTACADDSAVRSTPLGRQEGSKVVLSQRSWLEYQVDASTSNKE